MSKEQFMDGNAEKSANVKWEVYCHSCQEKFFFLTRRYIPGRTFKCPKCGAVLQARVCISSPEERDRSHQMSQDSVASLAETKSNVDTTEIQRFVDDILPRISTLKSLVANVLTELKSLQHGRRADSLEALLTKAINEFEASVKLASENSSRYATDVSQTIGIDAFFDVAMRKVQTAEVSALNHMQEVYDACVKVIESQKEVIERQRQALDSRNSRLFSPTQTSHAPTVNLSASALKNVEAKCAEAISPAKLSDFYEEWSQMVHDEYQRGNRSLIVDDLPYLFDIIELELSAREQSANSESSLGAVAVLRKIQGAMHQWQESHGLQRFPAVDDPFDYRFQQKIDTVIDNGLKYGEPEIVMKIVRHGYVCSDSERPLRKASVIVRVPPLHDVIENGES